MPIELPILYVKTSCPWCADAIGFLSEHGIGYREVNVSTDSAAFNAMEHASGQSRAPVLDWHGRILSDFDLKDLKSFLHAQKIQFEDS